MTSAYGLAMIDKVRNNTNITRLLCYWGRERERERERKIFFALLMAQNASFGNQGKSLVGKKSKVPFSIRNGGEKLKQVVFLMLMCTLH